MADRCSGVVCVLCLLSLVLWPLSGHAATRYVALTGQDTNPGTQAAPWRTLQHAADTASPGDLVQVGPGTYYERVRITRTNLTFVGAGTHASRIDGSDPIDGWVQEGDGIWRTRTARYVPFAMTANGKQIWRISDLMMTGNIPDDTWPDGWYFLRLPANEQTECRMTQFRFTHNAWDGVEALFGVLNGTTYVRFKDGDHPATMGVRIAPAGGTVTLDGAQAVTMRNFWIGGGQHAVLVTGGTSNTVIEHSFLTHGFARVMIEGGASNTIIRTNEITSDSIGFTDFRPGEWNCATQEFAARHRIYEINKFLVGTWDDFWYSDENDTGIQVQGDASNTQIVGNHIHDGLVGIKLNESDGTQILGNTINNFSAEGIFTFFLHDTVEIGGNRFADSDHHIRLQNLSSNATMHIYANRFHQRLEAWDGGKHVHGYTDDPYTCQHGCGPSTVWVYHNSFAGGGWAVDVGPDTPRMHVVNNLISTLGVSSGGTQFAEYDRNLELDLWRSEALPDFAPPREAQNAGRTLTNLPGMTPAYIGDGRPDIGAVQVGAGVSPPPAPAGLQGSQP